MNRRDFLSLSGAALVCATTGLKAEEPVEEPNFALFQSMFKMVCIAHHDYKIDIEQMYVSTPIYKKMWNIANEDTAKLLERLPQNLWSIPCVPKDLIGNVVVIHGKKGLIYFKDIENPKDFILCGETNV